MARLHRELGDAFRADCERTGEPLPISGGTNFSGAETLASMGTSPGAIGPVATPGLSVLSRECLEPIAPAYLARAGSRLHVRAYGTIVATATVPTFQLQLVAADAYANPLATHVATLANISAFGGTTTITPAAATGADWFLDVLMAVRTTGSAGTIIAVGAMLNNWAATATYVTTPFKNATPPTAVVAPNGGSGLLAPVYFDLNMILGAATASNTVTCLDYQLLSLN